ncbi:esterase-like activity of phytase-domain-containing protein [Mycena pura]|uniref:Esterase-like activity of phytase-domain-containing protein n=1 Tax=Mycena pura TaxID=153505 RepID=A0AAD6VJ90_9AGAR|nr:esterase-like activity of phytase-domain-containing protein [Mycena pura]
MLFLAPLLVLHVFALLHANALGLPKTPPPKPTPSQTAASTAVSVSLGDVTYVNHGLVGFGRIASNFTESTGDTLGGIGSSMAIKRDSWRELSNGRYTGTLVVQPDRGFNAISTIDYQARRHEIDFVFTPYSGSANLSFTEAQKTLSLTYKDTTLLFERKKTKTSGLDPSAIRAAEHGFGIIPLADPQMPIASVAEPHLTLDAEGIIANADGTYWLSDEYGPYIYLFSGSGNLIQTIQPPAAILPHDANGNLNFTANVDPATGRGANQGFEGLTIDPLTNTLYAILQSATIQDGALQLTRMLAYDVSKPTFRVPLIGEWVVPLPVSSSGKVEATSEIHFVSPGVFLCLARDGNGHGGSGDKIKYKHADLFSIVNATDIHGTAFDSPATPVAPNGELVAGVTPATYVAFVDYADPTQLARFGLHTGDPDDNTLIDSKWESLALAPVGPSAPNDYFLFTASDNDFLTTQGISLGVPYDAGEDVDNQFLVFRVTLPGAKPFVAAAIGTDSSGSSHKGKPGKNY